MADAPASRAQNPVALGVSLDDLLAGPVGRPRGDSGSGRGSTDGSERPPAERDLRLESAL
jgi:hypothetical protein